jgi:RNA polymerase sigma-70 factor, ECF subfamily
MSMSENTQITEWLERISAGDRRAVDQLLPVVYDELRRLAESQLQRERGDHTLQATALVHEAYMRLIGQRNVVWKNRAHFMAVAAQAIRRILVDHARARGSEKRGGGRGRMSLDSQLEYDDTQATDLVALDESLNRLMKLYPDKARVVELRFFGGLTVDDVAEVLGVTSRTVERHWQFARAWLFREIVGDPTIE